MNGGRSVAAIMFKYIYELTPLTPRCVPLILISSWLLASLHSLVCIGDVGVNNAPISLQQQLHRLHKSPINFMIQCSTETFPIPEVFQQANSQFIMDELCKRKTI